MNTIKIRTAAAHDLDGIASLFNDYRQFYQQASDLALAKDFIGSRLEFNESIILVAENTAHQLVGFCQLYPTFCSVEAAPIYVLYDLFVAPAARRQGIAAALLGAARQQGLDDKKVRLDLTTAKTNIEAQALYESLGWKRDEVFYTYNLSLLA